MKNLRHMILSTVVVGLCFNAPLVAKKQKAPNKIIKDSATSKLETSQEKYERACHAISYIVKQRNELRKELEILKKRLLNVFPDGQGNVIQKINELGELKAKLEQIEFSQHQQGDILQQMDSVINKIKEHEILIDIIANRIPDDIKLEEPTGVPEKDLQLKMQLFEAKYGAVGDERDRLKKNVSFKDKQLKLLRKECDELRHYLVELVNYADANR